MTDGDGVVGVIPGLIALGIMAGVAGKMIKGSSSKLKSVKAKPLSLKKPKENGLYKSKGNKIAW